MTNELPWNRFPEPEDELPYVPPAPTPTPFPPPGVTPSPTPGPQPVVDWSGVFEEAFKEAWPQIREQVIEYGKTTVQAAIKGQNLDITHPTVTATTSTGKELVVADARNRSWRTFLQGLCFDILAAIIAVVATLTGADIMSRDTWIAFGVLLLKSVVSAGISYVMRLRITPTIRTQGDKMQVVPLMIPVTPEEKAAA